MILYTVQHNDSQSEFKCSRRREVCIEFHGQSVHIVIELVQVEIVRNTSTLDCIDRYEVQ